MNTLYHRIELYTLRALLRRWLSRIINLSKVILPEMLFKSIVLIFYMRGIKIFFMNDMLYIYITQLHWHRVFSSGINLFLTLCTQTWPTLQTRTLYTFMYIVIITHSSFWKQFIPFSPSILCTNQFLRSSTEYCGKPTYSS